jgi:hypothetical protein
LGVKDSKKQELFYVKLPPNTTCAGQAGFGGILSHFPASSFFCSQVFSPPARLLATHTVRWRWKPTIRKIERMTENDESSF